MSATLDLDALEREQLQVLLRTLDLIWGDVPLWRKAELMGNGHGLDPIILALRERTDLLARLRAAEQRALEEHEARLLADDEYRRIEAAGAAKDAENARLVLQLFEAQQDIAQDGAAKLEAERDALQARVRDAEQDYATLSTGLDDLGIACGKAYGCDVMSTPEIAPTIAMLVRERGDAQARVTALEASLECRDGLRHFCTRCDNSIGPKEQLTWERPAEPPT